MWQKVRPVVDPGMAALCRRPYPLHRFGCPNFGKKAGCPPKCKPIGELLDLNYDIWAIWTRFNLYDHMVLMKAKHPEWSERQLRCCLYWQPRARRNLHDEMVKFAMQMPASMIVTTPEASGVNLSETMTQVGVFLQWPPVDWTYQIVLAGKKFVP